MDDLKVPQFFRYIIPIIEVLQELGGSGRAGEVVDLVIDKLNIPEEEIAETIKSGASRIKNQIQWTRLLLAKTGYLDSSQRGVWTLTKKGLDAKLTKQDLLDLHQKRKKLEKEYRKKKPTNGDGEDNGTEDYKTILLNILQELPPAGFERICQRLLRESNFEKVTVTGRSGDGGIDGIGIYQVNKFVSFKVLFQCKRYQGSVSASQVRDFRGAMGGRADKGIIMTTGSFTRDAKEEAQRSGVPPIELVDGDDLIEIFMDLELGLKAKTTYEIDDGFFDEFRD